jgi:UDP-glucose 4-epimerase
VFPSSGGTIYGNVDAPSVSETAPARPTSGYSFGKHMTEEALRLFARGSALTYTILRFSNPYGPGQVVKHDQGLIPAILSAAADGREFQIYGDGGAVRDYVFIADAVEALVRAILSPEASRNETVNVGSGQGASVLEVIALCEEFLTRRLPLASARRTARPSRAAFSTSPSGAASRLASGSLAEGGLKATVGAFRLREEGAAA